MFPFSGCSRLVTINVTDLKAFCSIINLDYLTARTYNTLDNVNFSAGLNGNIRLINSTHPKTGEKCEIIDGELEINYLLSALKILGSLKY